MELLNGTTFGVPIFHVYGHGAACQVSIVTRVHAQHGVGDNASPLLHAVFLLTSSSGQLWPNRWGSDRKTLVIFTKIGQDHKRDATFTSHRHNHFSPIALLRKSSL